MSDHYLTVEDAEAAFEETRPDTLARKLAMADIHVARARVTFGDHTSDNETIVSDLVADLMHLCERDGFSFEDILDTARGHYEAGRIDLTE